MDYQELRNWRGICEYLDSCWYKFDEISGLAKNCSGIASIFYEQERGRYLREELWQKWQIVLISWGQHPILYSRCSRVNRNFFGDACGWTLVIDWESKIDFLEKLVLFDLDENNLSRPWRESMRLRAIERKTKRIIRSGSPSERLELGLCPHCGRPQVVLMVDCPSCCKSYEQRAIRSFSFGESP